MPLTGPSPSRCGFRSRAWRSLSTAGRCTASSPSSSKRVCWVCTRAWARRSWGSPSSTRWCSGYRATPSGPWATTRPSTSSWQARRRAPSSASSAAPWSWPRRGCSCRTRARHAPTRARWTASCRSTGTRVCVASTGAWCPRCCERRPASASTSSPTTRSRGRWAASRATACWCPSCCWQVARRVSCPGSPPTLWTWSSHGCRPTGCGEPRATAASWTACARATAPRAGASSHGDWRPRCCAPSPSTPPPSPRSPWCSPTRAAKRPGPRARLCPPPPPLLRGLLWRSPRACDAHPALLPPGPFSET
nr:mitochondrial basic amino acids transporter isoform X4 [Chlorocebus sabaeus]